MRIQETIVSTGLVTAITGGAAAAMWHSSPRAAHVLAVVSASFAFCGVVLGAGVALTQRWLREEEARKR